LPDRLRVEGGLEWRHSPLRTFPVGVHLGDFLDLEGSPDLEALARGVAVPGWLRLRNCRKLIDLGEGLQVGVTSPRRNSISPWLYASLGPQSERRAPPMPGSLDLTGCERLERLPETLRATSIELAETNLKDISASCAHLLRWRGVNVPPQVILAPETYTPEQVLRERNAEVRRVLIERLGLERFIGLLRPEAIDQDTDPGGPRELLRLGVQGEREPYVALRCRCPSTGRTYLLRVPPNVITCRAAAAWLAGFDNPDDYAPLHET
jgi:hypothetical protein